MNLVILGAPGSGKGTQASRVAEEARVQHISTGDLLREAVAKKSPIGKRVESIMAEGKLVPDEIVLDLIRQKLSDKEERSRYEGWILDGYPRNLSQAEALEGVLEEIDGTIDAVIYIDLGADVIIDRLSKRRTCSECKAVYHLENKPPAEEGKCDVCGGRLIQREDDRPETIRKRLEVYESETLPVLGFYEKRRDVHRIDGGRSIDEIADKILGIMDL